MSPMGGGLRGVVRDLIPAAVAAVSYARSRSAAPGGGGQVTKVGRGTARATEIRDHTGRVLTLRKTRGKKRKRKIGLKDLKKSVTTIQKKMKGYESNLIFPLITSGYINSTSNNITWSSIALVTYSNLESAIQAVPYVNPADTATPVGFNALAIPNPTHWDISVSSHVNIRNNFYMPCNLRMYLMKARVNTTQLPEFFIQNVTKQDAGGLPSPGWQNIGLFANDATDLLGGYTIVETRTIRLSPGDETDYKFNKEFKYDQENHDTHAQDYLKDYTYFLVCRLEGVTCHDSDTINSVGISPSRLDWVMKKKLKLTYASDAPATFRSYLNSCQTIVTAAITGEAVEQETQA